MASVTVSGCEFQRCRVDAASWSDVRFDDCAWTSTTYQGALRRVGFTKCTFDQFEIADSAVQDVSLSPVPGGGVTLPESEAIFFIRGEDLPALIEKIEGEVDGNVAAVMGETAAVWAATDMLLDSSILVQGIDSARHRDVLAAAFSARPRKR